MHTNVNDLPMFCTEICCLSLDSCGSVHTSKKKPPYGGFKSPRRDVVGFLMKPPIRGVGLRFIEL